MERSFKKPNGVVLSDSYWVPNEGYAIAEERARNNNPIFEITDIEELKMFKRFLRPVMVI